MGVPYLSFCPHKFSTGKVGVLFCPTGKVGVLFCPPFLPLEKWVSFFALNRLRCFKGLKVIYWYNRTHLTPDQSTKKCK